jgi:PAS domain S-box-containing protein
MREIAEREQAEAALRKSEAHYRMISENTSDVIWTLDVATQRFTYVSPAVQKLRGYTPEEVLAQPLEAALTPDSLKQVGGLLPRLAEAYAEHRAPGRPEGMRVDQPCRDGSVVNTEVVATLLTDEQGRVTELLGVTRDVTRRLQIERALSEQRTLAEALRDTAAALNSTLDFDGVLERILSAAGRVVPHDAANIALMDETGVAQIVRAQGYDRYENAASALAALRFPVAETRTLRTIAESGEPLIIPDTSADPAWLRHQDLEWVRSYAGMPIGVRGRVVGFLGLDCAVPGYFTQAHVERLRAFADQVATAVENARLYEQTRRDAETKAELLREVNHRVKNNLVAIIGLLLAERRHAPAEGRRFVEPAIDDLIHRIESLLAVHEMLSSSQWAPMLLRDMIASVIRAVLGAVSRDRRVAVEIAGPPIAVSPRQANSLALAINELATNTVKYALPGRDTARITVRTAAEGDLIRIEYRDDGPGYPVDVVERRRESVGLYLLRQSVTRTLRGSLDLSNDDGAVAVMRIKAEETGRT